jgi:hypothetical protein
VSVSFSIISCFWSSRKTPSMILTLTSGIAGPPNVVGRSTDQR